MTRALTLALPILLTACATSSHAPKTVAVHKVTVEPTAALPHSPDVSAELMGWVVISDGEKLLRSLVTAPAKTTGTAGNRAGSIHDLEQAFAAGLGLDRVLAQVIDLRRPAAVAMLNPSLLQRGEIRPYLAMLPVIDRRAVEQAFVARGVKLEKTPWGFVLPTAQGHIHVAFDGGYAYVAWRADLLDAAKRVLGPKVRAHADAPLVVHVQMDNLYTAFKPQLGALLYHVARQSGEGGAGGDPQMAFALRSVRQMARFAGSVSAVELLANLDSGGLTVTARFDGKSDGAWAQYIGQLEPGPAWGVQFLPRDAVLVYTTHQSPRGRTDDIDAQLAYLADASPQKRPAADEVDRWRAALERAASSTGGELAYAVWPGRSGGVGVGGAYRLSDPGMARTAVMGVYDQLAGQLGPLLMRAMSLDPARLGSRFTMKKRQVRVADADVDLVELAVKWPADANAERRLFETLFGPKLVMATAFVGESALFAIGADWEPRLTAMLHTAQGMPAGSVGDEPAFAEALQYRADSRVSMSYLETGRMAQFAARLVAQVNDLDPKERAAVTALISQVGRGAIVTTTNANGRRFELTTHVPQSAIMGAARLNGAMWRVALSPLLNPPMMPPLPVPPPHVTPSVTPAGSDGPTL